MKKKPNLRKLKYKIFQRLTKYTRNQPFYLQSQMDIHPHSRFYNVNLIKETGGFYLLNDNVNREIVAFDIPWDSVRRDFLILFIRDLLVNGISGDLAELGVYKGYTAKLIHHYAPDRKLFLFDTYSGFDKNDMEIESERTGIQITSHFDAKNAEEVMKYINPKNDNVIPVVGVFPKSIPNDFNSRTFAFVHMDMDIYKPTIEALNYFYNKTASGGYLVIHDYNSWRGARSAVDEFFMNKTESPIPLPDKNGSAVIKKL